VLTAAIVPLSGYPLLYLPIHIVWLELLIHPTALLVFQDRPPLKGLARVARGQDAAFYDARGWFVILAVGTVVTVATVRSYQHALGPGADVEHARSIALAVLVIATATITAVLSGLRSWPARIMVLAALLSLVLLVQVPGIAPLVHLRPLHVNDWTIACTAGALTGALALLLRLRGHGAEQGRSRAVSMP
jgi:Ca2+-transporting ATPase